MSEIHGKSGMEYPINYVPEVGRPLLLQLYYICIKTEFNTEHVNGVLQMYVSKCCSWKSKMLVKIQLETVMLIKTK